MAGVTSISQHPSTSALYPKFHSSSLAYNFHSGIEASTCCAATKDVRLCTRRSSSSYRALTIQNAATKPAKSPAEEEWKIKRQVLLEKKAHPEGAINVQIYRLIKEWTPWDIARRVAFAFFGIFAGTEENPEFISSVDSKLAKDAKIIVACATGGTTRPSQNFPEGQQSRSFIAAYLLVLNGFTNVFHLDGGLSAWFKEDLPAVYAEE